MSKVIPSFLIPLKELCERHGVGFRYRKSSRSQKRLKVEGTQVNFWTFKGGSVVLTGIDSVSEDVWGEIVDVASPLCTGGWTTC